MISHLFGTGSGKLLGSCGHEERSAMCSAAVTKAMVDVIWKVIRVKRHLRAAVDTTVLAAFVLLCLFHRRDDAVLRSQEEEPHTCMDSTRRLDFVLRLKCDLNLHCGHVLTPTLMGRCLYGVFQPGDHG